MSLWEGIKKTVTVEEDLGFTFPDLFKWLLVYSILYCLNYLLGRSGASVFQVVQLNKSLLTIFCRTFEIQRVLLNREVGFIYIDLLS